MTSAVFTNPNFDNLEGFVSLVEALRIRVSSPHSEPEHIGPGKRYFAGDYEFEDLNLTLIVPWVEEMINESCNQSKIETSDVFVFVINEDRFLKQRDVLFKVPILDAIGDHPLAGGQGHRVKSLLNRRTGADLHIHLVMGQAIAPLRGRPHRQGTKLASTTMQLRSNGSGLGFDPKPLTIDVAREYGVPKSSLVFLRVLDDLSSTSDLDDSIEVYIKESLFHLLGRRGIGSEGRAIAESVALDVARQIVFLTSQSLAADGIAAAPDAASIQLILTWMKDAGSKISREQLLEKLRDEPTWVAAWITSGKATKRFEELIVDLIQPEVDDDEVEL